MSEPRPTPTRRLPTAGRPVPVSTYRVQLGADLTLDDVAARVPYLATLGVTHVYLSPVLRAAPGSTHGYDVVDHDEIAPELGGLPALRRLATTAHDAGLGLVLDIVPNHMAVPTPVWHNRALWSVLAEGPDSPYADWFDVDWSAGDGAVLMPVLGDRIGAVLGRDELALDEVEIPGEGTRTVLRYYDHVFPVRPGTESLSLAELVERQHYRLAYWRVADEELNYRRFFDVGTLLAVRVEDPDVFDATHRWSCRCSRTARSTASGSTTRTVWPTRRATWRGCARRAVAPGLSSRRSSRATRRSRPTGRPPAAPGYEALWRIQETFVDPGGAACSARSCTGSPATRPTRSRRSPSRPSARSSTAPCTRRCTG